MAKKPNSLFKSLTLETLEDRFEDYIVEHGQRCHSQGQVSNLTLTPDGDLLAWVKDTGRHAVTVEVTQGEFLDTYCTCDEAVDCKHGVAVILECQALLKAKRTLPQCEKNDPRLGLLSENGPDADSSTASISALLNRLTKAQLVSMINDVFRNVPGAARAAQQHLPAAK